MNNWPRSEASRATVKFWRQSFRWRHYVFYWGVYLFYSPPSNFSRLTLVDRSCIFCGFFFLCFSTRNCKPAFYLSVTGLRKRSFWFSLADKKFSLNISLFLGFPSVEKKSDDGYQIGPRISSDNYCFIQWEPSEIIRWVINIYICKKLYSPQHTFA